MKGKKSQILLISSMAILYNHVHQREDTTCGFIKFMKLIFVYDALQVEAVRKIKSK